MESKPAERPHAVVIPCPFQSHIKANLKLAKLLHHKGFFITFVNTEFNHKRLLRSRGSGSLDGSPDFRFETIPDGLPPSETDASQDRLSVGKAVLTNFLTPFLDLIGKLNSSLCSRVPPVTCIVSDGFMPFTIKAAEELRLPVVVSFTMSACGVMAFKQLRALVEKGLIPLKGESYLDTAIDWIPGMKDIRLKDFPLAQRIDPDDFEVYFTVESVECTVKALAIVVHTFDALEPDVLDGLSSIFRRVHAIGPYQLLLNQIQEDSSESVGYNLWKEESECLQWLDTKEPNSVLYVNFGSVIFVTEEQLVEFAMGLADSKHPFLWIIRPDLVIGDSATLPAELAAETQNRSFIASWCPQEEVLNHPSVGGFLTHSGWNSTIESLSAGVPMICWPFFGDQQMNCRYSCNEWGVGMEIDNKVKREEVEKLVRDLMEGEKGKKMKGRAMDWKRLAEEASEPTGSSSINLEKLVSELLQSN
ncbi:hypothetical protein DKX38_008915 [Salix brachista]|uniref:Glycosyltransferase n=1 Tax=Salix brachista TaxID=2182728 RepID=A0A5N5M965_9ROSI|nr:hypothetical protein DKX38_008915 [Salix brachista]